MSFTTQELATLRTMIRAYENGKTIFHLEKVKDIDNIGLIDVVNDDVGRHATDIKSPQMEHNREDIALLLSGLATETGERKQVDTALSNWISKERETRIETSNTLVDRIEAIERMLSNLMAPNCSTSRLANITVDEL